MEDIFSTTFPFKFNNSGVMPLVFRKPYQLSKTEIALEEKLTI